MFLNAQSLNLLAPKLLLQTSKVHSQWKEGPSLPLQPQLISSSFQLDFAAFWSNQHVSKLNDPTNPHESFSSFKK